MKKKILVMAFAFALVNVSAENKKESTKSRKVLEVPESVKSAFTAKFPSATKVKWSLEKEGEYETEFVQNKVEISTLYEANGTLLCTETEILKSDLPAEVQATLARDFADYKFDEIEKADQKGVITYELEAEKGKEKSELVFDINGKLLKQELVSKK